jgi:hypothetical protein
VPQLLGDTDEEMCQLVVVVKELIAADRTLMLPAIGALGEVALPEAHKPELAQLALGALPLADESDLPTLVRCVLGALPPAQAGRTLRQLRSQLGAVSSGTLALLLQVVANTLRVNGGTARALLTQTGAASHLTRWEAMLLLLLLPMPRHAAAATQALSRALCRGALTAAELVACATDSALPAIVLPRLPPLCAALLADPAVDAAACTGAAAVAAHGLLSGRSWAAPATAAHPAAADERHPGAHRDRCPHRCAPATSSHGHPGQRAVGSADAAARALAPEHLRAGASVSSAGFAPCAGGARGALRGA